MIKCKSKLFINDFFCSWTAARCPIPCAFQKTVMTQHKVVGLRLVAGISHTCIFFFLMNWNNMDIQTLLLQTPFVTNSTFKLLLFLMVWINVCFQWRIICKPLISNFKFERFFFSSWTAATCTFNFACCKIYDEHISQLDCTSFH